MSRTHFTEYVNQQGYPVSHPNDNGTYNNIFNIIDTEEKAYWLGFLYADGYVRLDSYDVSITLQERDKEHLEKFKKFVNSPCKIAQKIVKLEDKQFMVYHFNINRKQIHEDLIKLGCTNKKSLTMKFPTEQQVPSYLLKHFVRGYIDGDGYIGLHTLKNGKIVIRISITSGSLEFIQELVNKMNWQKNTIRKDKRSNCYCIEWGSLKNNQIMYDLYENASVYLDRKYEYFLQLKNAVSNQADNEI